MPRKGKRRPEQQRVLGKGSECARAEGPKDGVAGHRQMQSKAATQKRVGEKRRW